MILKFRGEHVVKGYPYFYGDAIIKADDGKTYLWEANVDHEVSDDGDPESDIWVVRGLLEVIPETVSQFTGRLDKNNVEIYEHDFVTYFVNGVKKFGVIVFYEGSFCIEDKNNPNERIIISLCDSVEVL